MNARTHYEAMAREAAAAQIDVIAAIKRASQLLQMTEASQEARDHAARRLELAGEVLKELIEAARAFHQWQASDIHGRRDGALYRKAQAMNRSALARVSGGA